MRPELIWLLQFEDSNYCLGRELEQPPPLLSTSENIGFIVNSCCSRDLALLNKFTWFTQPGSLSAELSLTAWLPHKQYVASLAGLSKSRQKQCKQRPASSTQD